MPAATLRKNLRASMTDGLAYSLMVGLGESFLSAYILARGHSEFAASIISTAPLFVGAVMQLFAPYGIQKIGSYRRWVLFTASVQTITLLGLAVATRFAVSYTAIFIVISIYWASSLATGPAWNAWLSQIIPPKVRVSFFSVRSRWSHLLTFAGLGFAGWLLHFVATHPELGLSMTSGYTVIFVLAALARATSLMALNQQSPPRGHPAKNETADLGTMARVFSESKLRRFMMFLLLFQTASNLSSGLFSPFMLGELRLSYLQYMSLLATALLARFITLAYARPLITRFGLKGVFWISLILISPVPMFWTKTTDPSFYYLFQTISGIGWGFYELVAFLTLFNDLPSRERASLLTFFNLLQTTGIVIGSLLGGFVFRALGETYGAYDVVFTASTALRVATWAALPGLPWHLIRLRTWIELRPISVRAQGGILARPIIVRIPIPRRRRTKPLPEKPDQQ
ncbi:MAG: MFS transporter [Bdellovibrionales bacterium]